VSIVLRGSNFALRKTVFRTCDRRNLGAAFALSSIFVLRTDAASGKGPQFTIVVKRVAVTYADLGRSAVTSVVSAAVAKQIRRVVEAGRSPERTPGGPYARSFLADVGASATTGVGPRRHGQQGVRNRQGDRHPPLVCTRQWNEHGTHDRRHEEEDRSPVHQPMNPTTA
jgi:hypothetical protein